MTAVWVARAAAVAFAAIFGTAAVLRHRAFESGRFDLGNMVQAVWSTAHGEVLSVTDLSGVQASRLGSHFDPILAAFAPLWWLWPSPELLLVVQAAAVGAGALPVHWLARKHLGDGRAAAALATAYLLLPSTQWLVLSDFHPVALACPLLLFAWWHLDEGRLWAFGLLAALALTTKEHVGLALAGIGLWYALRRAPRAGLAIALLGTAAALTAALVVVPHFAPAEASPFEQRYEEPSLGLRDLRYGAALLAGLGFLPLAAPAALLPALPELGLNALSSTLTQTSLRTHYAATIVPALLVAAILGAARLHPRAAYGAALAALAGAVLAGPLGRVELAADARDAAARRAVALVPAGAAVSATNALGAHLSARERVLSFPVLAGARWVAVDTRRLTSYDSLDPEPAAAELARLRRDPGWEEVYAERGVVVLRRR